MTKTPTYLFMIWLLMLCSCSGPGGGPRVIEGASPNSGTNTDAQEIPPISVQKLTYKIGPFALPAETDALNESPGSIDFQTEEPLWITSFEYRMEDGNGGGLPSNLLHTAVLTNGGEQNPLCTEKQVANPFMAVTGATKKIELPDRHGYPVLPEDRLDATIILQNPTTQIFGNVYFVFTLTAVPMKAAKGFTDISPLFLDMDPCDHTPIAIAPKEFTKRDASFIVPENGLLMKAYGLLQDYGVNVSLATKDQPTPLWSAMAELSEEHKVIYLPVFEDPAGIPLTAGDQISISVAYDNVSEQWQADATGAIMAYMARTGEKEVMSANNAQKILLSPALDFLMQPAP